jgi:DNA-binding NarL/FixJ family response regulator
MKRILLVDDHLLVRTGIITFLSKSMPHLTYSDAGSIEEAEVIIANHSIDLILCDISLNKQSGLDLLQKYARRIPFVMLSIFDEGTYAKRCAEMGAKAYLNKGCNPNILVNTIEKILTNPGPCTAGLRSSIPLTQPLLALLSDREREVLEDTANAMSVMEIAVKRGLSINTVKTYRRRIMDKTNCKNANEILFFALKCGIVQAPI